jgi:hypothetical protein
MYSHFIFNYVRNIERERGKNERMKKENIKPGGRQGFMSIKETGAGLGARELVVDQLPTPFKFLFIIITIIIILCVCVFLCECMWLNLHKLNACMMQFHCTLYPNVGKQNWKILPHTSSRCGIVK